MEIFDSLTKKMQQFRPKKRGEVRMYTCGPTVYARPHIGNFRTYVWEDLFKRYLIYLGYKVTHVMNITDFDNSIVKEAKKRKCDCRKLALECEGLFRHDADLLEILPADSYPHVSQYVDRMADWVIQLQQAKLAYKDERGRVFFDISKYPPYGELSGSRLKPKKRKVMLEEYKRYLAGDFLIWKPCSTAGKKGGFCFQSKLGWAYPAWNLHCAVMSFETLGRGIDVAMGGKDNIFNHHENTRALVEALKGEYAKYWIHIRHLIVNGQKMSKTKGNVIYLQDLLKKGFTPRAVRFLLLSVHYRKRLNFTWEYADAIKKRYGLIKQALQTLKEKDGKENKQFESLAKRLQEEFEECMDCDLNAPCAIAAIERFLQKAAKEDASKRQVNAALLLLGRLDGVLAILPK
ncbi:MAG: class I tRNA ligase family protein [Candidatus Anstonellaceae archaeon]